MCVPHKEGHHKCQESQDLSYISELGGWKHTSAFHKMPKMNRHQMLKNLGVVVWLPSHLTNLMLRNHVMMQFIINSLFITAQKAQSQHLI